MPTAWREVAERSAGEVRPPHEERRKGCLTIRITVRRGEGAGKGGAGKGKGKGEKGSQGKGKGKKGGWGSSAWSVGHGVPLAVRGLAHPVDLQRTSE